MSDLSATLEVVCQFLLARGYDMQERIADVRNGRWIYDWCQEKIEQGLCPSCVDKALHNLFSMLEQGCHIYGTPLIVGKSAWTRACTNVALRAGGFKEWPEKE